MSFKLGVFAAVLFLLSSCSHVNQINGATRSYESIKTYKDSFGFQLNSIVSETQNYTKELKSSGPTHLDPGLEDSSLTLISTFESSPYLAELSYGYEEKHQFRLGHSKETWSVKYIHFAYIGDSVFNTPKDLIHMFHCGITIKPEVETDQTLPTFIMPSVRRRLKEKYISYNFGLDLQIPLNKKGSHSIIILSNVELLSYMLSSTFGYGYQYKYKNLNLNASYGFTNLRDYHNSIGSAIYYILGVGYHF